jgi:dipeptide transport system substrate-binding protein
MFAQQQPFSPIAHSTVYQPIRKNATNFKIDPFGSTVFSGVGLH